MLKDKTMSAHLLPLGVWLFQEIFFKLAAIFLSFSFRLQVKGKGSVMTDKGNRRLIRTGQFFTLLNR